MPMALACVPHSLLRSCRQARQSSAARAAQRARVLTRLALCMRRRPSTPGEQRAIACAAAAAAPDPPHDKSRRTACGAWLLAATRQSPQGAAVASRTCCCKPTCPCCIRTDRSTHRMRRSAHAAPRTPTAQRTAGPVRCNEIAPEIAPFAISGAISGAISRNSCYFRSYFSKMCSDTVSNSSNSRLQYSGRYFSH